ASTTVRPRRNSANALLRGRVRTYSVGGVGSGRPDRVGAAIVWLRGGPGDPNRGAGGGPGTTGTSGGVALRAVGTVVASALTAVSRSSSCRAVGRSRGSLASASSTSVRSG